MSTGISERKAFNFYKSHWEQIKLLSDKQKLNLFNAICKVQFLEVNIEDIVFNDSITVLVWTGIKHSLATSINGYLSKKKALGEHAEPPHSKGLNKGGTKPQSKGLDMEGAQQEKEEEKEKGEVKEKEEKKNNTPKGSNASASVFVFKKELLMLGVENLFADEWIKVRKNKKAVNTKTAFDAILREFNKSGLTPNECVQKAVENSWGGFKANWLNENKSSLKPKGFSPGQKHYQGSNNRVCEDW